MTEILISRGDTFPRSFLESYRASKTSEQFYNDLSSSKSDEFVLQNAADIAVSDGGMFHGRSENLLDITSCLSPTQEDFLTTPDVILPRSHRRRPLHDRVDPEDSIRDIVTENDFYR